ncbi:MAG: S1 family peptidase [Actinomycetota bacterium]|nr:S1 family peptidase [Actinomycetota bacterium]
MLPALPAASVTIPINSRVFPGAAITVGQNKCTGAFAFVDQVGRLFISTAGHCVDSAARADRTTPSGDRMWRGTRGPLVTDGGGNVLGHVTYAALSTGIDFALIELARGVVASNVIPGSGRITHVAVAPHAETQINLYGQGLGVSDAMPERTGLITAVEPSIVRLAIASVPGDSGGPVYDTTSGAVGILMGSDVSITPDVGVIRASRLNVMLARVSRALKAKLVLLRS